MPADVDGSNQPPSGAPNPFTEIGTNPTWKVWRFHVDFGTPAELDLHPGRQPRPRRRSRHLWRWELCAAGGHRRHASTRSATAHVPERLPPLHDGHEALVGNMTVSSNGVAGVRWYEINNATIGLTELRPAEHLPARQHVALDGKRCDGRARRPRRRLQRVVAPASTRRSATRGGWPAIRRTRWRRARRRSSPAPAARPTPSAAGATTPTSRSTP